MISIVDKTYAIFLIRIKWIAGKLIEINRDGQNHGSHDGNELFFFAVQDIFYVMSCEFCSTIVTLIYFNKRVRQFNQLDGLFMICCVFLLCTRAYCVANDTSLINWRLHHLPVKSESTLAQYTNILNNVTQCDYLKLLRNLAR